MHGIDIAKALEHWERKKHGNSDTRVN